MGPSARPRVRRGPDDAGNAGFGERSARRRAGRPGGLGTGAAPLGAAQALAFTNKIGELAEAEAHHPAVLTEWGRTTVTWWTHKIKGLHRNDFVMAAKTDQLFSEQLLEES